MGKSPVQQKQESKDGSPTNGDSSGSSSMFVVLVLIAVAVGLAVLLKDKIFKNKNKKLSDIQQQDEPIEKHENIVEELTPQESEQIQDKFGN